MVGQVFALLNDLQEAEDVTQNAFAKASFHWQRIATYDQPEAWVRRVAFNEAYNSTRRARRWLAALARHGPPPPVPAVSPDRVDLHRALQRLSPRHREVLVLHYVAELPVDEVARQLRCGRDGPEPPQPCPSSPRRRGRRRARGSDQCVTTC